MAVPATPALTSLALLVYTLLVTGLLTIPPLPKKNFHLVLQLRMWKSFLTYQRQVFLSPKGSMLLIFWTKLEFFIIPYGSKCEVLGHREPYFDLGRYIRLLGKCNYLTRPDIAFLVSIVSQLINSTCENHWNAAIRILRYIKGSN